MAIQVITLITGIVVARILGPENRGILAAAILWPTLIAGLGLLGTNSGIALKTGGHTADLQRIMRCSLGLALKLSIFCMVVAWLILPFLIPDSQKQVLELSRFFILFVPFNILVALMQSIDLGVKNISRFNITRLSFNPLYLAIVLLLWLLELTDVIWFVSALITANAITFFIRLLMLDSKMRFPLFDFQWSIKVLRDSVKFFVTGIGTLIQSQMERILLLWTLGMTEMGLYTIALSVAGLQMAVSKSVGFVVFSRGVGLSERESTEDMARIFRYMVIAGAGIGGCMLLVIPWAIPLFFGEPFAEAVWPALVLVMACFCLSLVNIVDEGFRSQGNPYVGLEARAVAVVVFVAIGIPLSGVFGIIGVAFASLTGYLMATLFVIYRLRKKTANNIVPTGADLVYVVNAVSRTIAGSRDGKSRK